MDDVVGKQGVQVFGGQGHRDFMVALFDLIQFGKCAAERHFHETSPRRVKRLYVFKVVGYGVLEIDGIAFAVGCQKKNQPVGIGTAEDGQTAGQGNIPDGGRQVLEIGFNGF